MLSRRSFLATAALLPAAKASAGCYGSEPFGGGSSVAPVGRVGSMRTGGPCPQPPQPTPWINNYTREWYAAINTFNIAVGAKMPPPNTYAISGLEDPWFRAQLKPGEYADLTNLRDLMTYGGAAGGSIGFRRGGPSGATAGAILGVEVAFVMWLGYNLGVLANRLPSYFSAPLPGVPSYNGTAAPTPTAVGSTHGGVGTGGWIVIQVGGSGDTILNELF